MRALSDFLRSTLADDLSTIFAAAVLVAAGLIFWSPIT
jgi:hypothetical protein